MNPSQRNLAAGVLDPGLRARVRERDGSARRRNPRGTTALAFLMCFCRSIWPIEHSNSIAAPPTS